MNTTVQLEDLIKSSQKGYRVDVVKLAKKLNLPVYSVDLPDEQSGHLYDGDNPYIEVNRNHPVTRQRFTIAHEVSHYIIHDKLLKEKGQMDRKMAYDNEQEAKIEAEADATAASILMPNDLVQKYFKKQGWNKLTRFNTEMVEKVASEFRVSREMAVTRLRDLKFSIPYLVFA